jgi:hypothetical protein
MKNAWLAFVVFMDSTILLAQDAAPTCQGILCSVIEKFPGIGMLIVYLVSLQMILRGVAEALIYLSAKTETETDNKIAAYVSQASWVLGNLLAKFGYSVPKAVIEEKAIAMASKPLTEAQKADGK